MSENKGKIDIQANLTFHKVKITVGEVAVVDEMEDNKMEDIWQSVRSEIPHIDIFNLIFEDLSVKYEQGKSTDVHIGINRIFIQDVQKTKVRKYKGII